MVDELPPAVDPIREVAGVGECRGEVAERVADKACAGTSGTCGRRESVGVSSWCKSSENRSSYAPSGVQWVVELAIKRGNGILCRSGLEERGRAVLRL